MFARIGDACAIELMHVAESITTTGRILLQGNLAATSQSCY